LLGKVLVDERGNAFLDNALLIILLTFGVAGFIVSLAGALGAKFTEITGRVNQIGTP
jgi:Flp pilus assembly pilin Flp